MAACSIAGCVLPGDNQEAQNNQELRGIVASDRQQINALQDQVARLNDRIAEMEHEGDSGDEVDADKNRLAQLEHEVQQMKSGAAPPAGPIGPAALPPNNPGGPSNFGPAPAGPPGFGGPAAMGAPPPDASSAPPGPGGAYGNA
ncbi:MAG TPA: hypothetical protein VHS07_02345, partial [Candidatus Binataceae bacterium]|nr:hypothetical protein [Candidatus Binataceae bacterium]